MSAFANKLRVYLKAKLATTPFSHLKIHVTLSAIGFLSRIEVLTEVTRFCSNKLPGSIEVSPNGGKSINFKATCPLLSVNIKWRL